MRIADLSIGVTCVLALALSQPVTAVAQAKPHRFAACLAQIKQYCPGKERICAMGGWVEAFETGDETPAPYLPDTLNMARCQGVLDPSVMVMMRRHARGDQRPTVLDDLRQCARYGGGKVAVVERSLGREAGYSAGVATGKKLGAAASAFVGAYGGDSATETDVMSRFVEGFQQAGGDQKAQAEACIRVGIKP